MSRRGGEGMESRRSIRGKLVVFAIWCLLVLAVLPAQAAQELPAISPDTGTMNVPGKIGVGPDGTIYVVDGSRGHVEKFSPSGQHLGEISLPGVSAVAVASNGTIYLGSHRDYSVTIFSNGMAIGKLGIGTAEFLSIRDIAVDGATGRVFVVDAAGNDVKIFDASGNRVGRIGSLHLPLSVAVANRKIYILDSPEIQDPMTTEPKMTTIPRISVFNSKYSLVSTIDASGDFGTVFRPTDIAVSPRDVLYVGDISAGRVFLFDTTGTSQGEINSADARFSPVSLAFSPDGTLLYVSSNKTSSIHRFTGVQ